MRITDQYFWNVLSTLFFLCLVFLATVILESKSYKTFETLALVDFVLITLASWRVVRLVVYDKVSAFFREQFYDVLEQKGKVLLVKPERGPRRALLDLLTCPWCFGLWATATVSFFYLLTPWMFFPTLILALSTVATLLQLFSNLVGWKAEQAKNEVEGV